MVFYLDESIIGRLNEEIVQEALSNIGHAVKSGIHILYCERKVLEVLYKSEFLDDGTKRIYKKFFLSGSEMKEYFNSTKFYVQLIGEKQIIKKEQIMDKNILKMSIDYLIETTLLNEVMIICEDIDDYYNVYGKIGEYYLYKNKIDKLKIRLNAVSGSGSGISNSFKKKMDENKYFVIAIADTDKIAPKDDIGKTLKDLLEEYNKIKDKCLGEIFYSKFNEVENLIPMYIYEKEIKLSDDEIESYIESAITKEVIDFKENTISFKDFLLLLHREKREDMTNYFDFKKGLDRKRYNKKEVKEYWKGIIEDSGLKESMLKEDGYIIERYAKRPMNKLSNLLKEESVRIIDEKLGREKKELWEEIGMFLYSWGCAPIKPMRVM